MSDNSSTQWTLELEYLQSCNCDYGCPCNFNALPTYGNCEALLAYHVLKGNFGETNLDDVSPEILGFVMEKAFETGVLDCWFTPIQMKKNRPATLVSILCQKHDKDKFIALLVRETPTLGLRIREIERVCLAREITTIKTKFGEIPVKIARFGGEIVNVKPEFEILKEIAKRENLPLREVEAEIQKSII